MRKIHFSDHLEQSIAETLFKLGIDFVHESEDKNQTLDFYLPDFDLYIEVKQYFSERVFNQLKTDKDIILIQGKSGVRFLEALLVNREAVEKGIKF